MAEYDYDLFVIGGGSGGVRAARWAGSLGKKVAICEQDRWGGTCVIRGCIPKKLMSYAGHFSDEIELAKDYGFAISGVSHDWKMMKENRETEVARLSGLYQGMLDKNGVHIVAGRGKIKSAHEIEVNGAIYSTQKILIATGSRPYTPAIEGAEHSLNSNDIFALNKCPQKILIVGGGYIAVEFASILNGLGVDVHLMIRHHHVLRHFDTDSALFLQQEMKKKGVQFLEETSLLKIQLKGEKKVATFSNGQTTEFDQILMATGRIPNIEGLGLEKIGIKLKENGAIITNQHFQTSVESIFALGDVTDKVNLTPVATAEGTIFAENNFNHQNFQMSYEHIPSAVFSNPPLATVGLAEDQARLKYQQVDIYKSDFRALRFTLGDIQERTLVKLVVDGETSRVVGAHMVGEGAPDVMQGIAIAVKMGATKKDFDQTIGIHPTSAEEFVTLRNKA